MATRRPLATASARAPLATDARTCAPNRIQQKEFRRPAARVNQDENAPGGGLTEGGCCRTDGSAPAVGFSEPVWRSGATGSWRAESWGSALLRRYAAAIDQGQDEIATLEDEYRAGLRELVAEFGQPAIDAAINELRDEASPSASLH